MTWEQLGEFAAMGTALLWTLSTLVWTSTGRKHGVLPVSFLRLVIACVFLMGYGQLVRGLWLPTDATRHTWLLLGVSGFFGFFLADLCSIKAFVLIGPRLALLIQSLTPPLAVLITWLVQGDQLGPRHGLAMGVTLVGVIWVVLEQPEQSPHPRKPHHVAWGIVLALLASGGQAVGYVLTKQGLGDYDAVAATFIRIIGALIGYVVLATVLRRWTVIGSTSCQAKPMLLLTLGALIGPFLGVILCMIALRHCQAGVAATIIGMMPVLILPFVIFLYREKVSLRAAGGALVSVAGIALLML
jgi:drug/metabolite transporter (DMT)-like permease